MLPLGVLEFPGEFPRLGYRELFKAGPSPKEACRDSAKSRGIRCNSGCRAAQKSREIGLGEQKVDLAAKLSGRIGRAR